MYVRVSRSMIAFTRWKNSTKIGEGGGTKGRDGWRSVKTCKRRRWLVVPFGNRCPVFLNSQMGNEFLAARSIRVVAGGDFADFRRNSATTFCFFFFLFYFFLFFFFFFFFFVILGVENGMLDDTRIFVSVESWVRTSRIFLPQNCNNFSWF